MRIVVGTKNKKKLAELMAMLPEGAAEIVSVDEIAPDLPSPEETGSTFEDNAKLKALYFAEHTGLLCIADDSGLEIDALDGAPGVYSARWAGTDGDDEANNAKLLEEFAKRPDAERGAQFHCVIAVASPGCVHLTREGVVRGEIIDTPRGDGGFGYDPYFYHPPSGCAFAELEREAKATVSHRGLALEALGPDLNSLLTIIANRSCF